VGEREARGEHRFMRLVKLKKERKNTLFWTSPGQEKRSVSHYFQYSAQRLSERERPTETRVPIQATLPPTQSRTQRPPLPHKTRHLLRQQRRPQQKR
jgi:hypothetical protein